MGSVQIAIMIAAGAYGTPHHANLDSSLAPFEASAQPKALFLGDSLTLREGTFFEPLRAAIQQRLGGGGAGWQSMSLWTGGGFDPGWTQGQVNSDTMPYRSIDGLWASTAGTAWGRLDPAPGTKRMQFVVNGNGSFGLWNTATLQTTFHTAPGVFDVAFPGSAGRVWVQPSANGTVTVLGALTTNEQGGAIISRGANGGWGVNNFLHRDETFEQVGSLISPDLIWITLGQNDTPWFTPPQYTAAMRQLVQRVRSMAPAAGVVLCSSYDSGSDEIGYLSNAVYDAAIAEGVGFVNLYLAGGSFDFFEKSGYLADGVHFTSAGGLYVAGILDAAIRSHGRSLRFCAGDVNQDGSCDGGDLSVLLSQFGETGVPWMDGDLNGDSLVNGADLSIFLGGFGCERFVKK